MNMPLDEQLQAPEQTQGSPDEELDLKIAVMMGERLLEDGGFDVIDRAVASSKDPGQVIGQFIMQMGQQLFEGMPDDMKLSPSIMLADGGWVEQISDYIQKQAGVKKEIMDKAEIYVASTAQQMAQGKQQQGDPNAPPVAPGPNAAPPIPQPGGMQ
jgi:hypothetical protein